MRKRIDSSPATEGAPPGGHWLDLESIATAELTSEDPAFPIESALSEGRGEAGWRAAGPGEQRIRLVFDEPQRVRRIWLDFVEQDVERTQQYVLRWSPDRGATFHEIVRQQWNFSPKGANRETEDHEVDLADVTVLELSIAPEIGGGDARASLAGLRIG
jgi:hypothetical protein